MVGGNRFSTNHLGVRSSTTNDSNHVNNRTALTESPNVERQGCHENISSNDRLSLSEESKTQDEQQEQHDYNTNKSYQHQFNEENPTHHTKQASKHLQISCNHLLLSLASRSRSKEEALFANTDEIRSMGKTLNKMQLMVLSMLPNEIDESIDEMMSNEVIARDLIASVGKIKTATSTTISHHANDKGGTRAQSIISLNSPLETIVAGEAHRSNKTAPKEEDEVESNSRSNSNARSDATVSVTPLFGSLDCPRNVQAERTVTDPQLELFQRTKPKLPLLSCRSQSTSDGANQPDLIAYSVVATYSVMQEIEMTITDNPVRGDYDGNSTKPWNCEDEHDHNDYDDDRTVVDGVEDQKNSDNISIAEGESRSDNLLQKGPQAQHDLHQESENDLEELLCSLPEAVDSGIFFTPNTDRNFVHASRRALPISTMLQDPQPRRNLKNLLLTVKRAGLFRGGSVKEELDSIRKWHIEHGFRGGLVLRELREDLYDDSFRHNITGLNKHVNPNQIHQRECYYLYYEVRGNGQVKQQIFCRGTTLRADVLTNLNLKYKYDPELGCRLHAGFRNHADRLLHDVLPLLVSPTDKRSTIEVCGHSLGGAVALILAAKLRKRGYTVVRATTIGSPKVCDRSAVPVLTLLLPADTLRIENDRDVVPNVPPQGSHVPASKLWFVRHGPTRYVPPFRASGQDEDWQWSWVDDKPSNFIKHLGEFARSPNVHRVTSYVKRIEELIAQFEQRVMEESLINPTNDNHITATPTTVVTETLDVEDNASVAGSVQSFSHNSLPPWWHNRHINKNGNTVINNNDFNRSDNKRKSRQRNKNYPPTMYEEVTLKSAVSGGFWVGACCGCSANNLSAQ